MSPKQKPIARLLRIMARLRSPRGCPWDREQTHQTIKQDLVEECYEVVDAIESRDDEALCEELGDLLLQVVFHAQMAREKQRFDFDDVATSIVEKLVRRHPHVFGKSKLKTAGQVLTQWHQIKKSEKKQGSGFRVQGSGRPESVLDGVPKHLPALMKAQAVQKKAARVGFDWRKADDVAAKIEEEWRELRQAMRCRNRQEIEEELGDLLFATVNLARFQKFDAEDALNQTVNKFRRRFEQIEREIQRRGKRLEDCSLEELDAIWNRAKRK